MGDSFREGNFTEVQLIEYPTISPVYGLTLTFIVLKGHKIPFATSTYLKGYVGISIILESSGRFAS